MNETIYAALCACFALSPSSDEAALLIREAYQDPEPSPRPPRDSDVIYYTFSPDPYAAEPPPSYTETSPTTFSHAPAVSIFSAWKLLLVCYGPNAPANARLIRSFLFLDGAGFPRSILRKAGLYPVPDPPEPLVGHEPEGSLWRLRADLTISLRVSNTQTRTGRRYGITDLPSVILSRST